MIRQKPVSVNSLLQETCEFILDLASFLCYRIIVDKIPVNLTPCLQKARGLEKIPRLLAMRSVCHSGKGFSALGERCRARCHRLPLPPQPDSRPSSMVRTGRNIYSFSRASLLTVYPSWLPRYLPTKRRVGHPEGWPGIKNHPAFRLDDGGGGWIRTTEVSDNRFTVCPIWPLWNSSI